MLNSPLQSLIHAFNNLLLALFFSSDICLISTPKKSKLDPFTTRGEAKRRLAPPVNKRRQVGPPVTPSRLSPVAAALPPPCGALPHLRSSPLCCRGGRSHGRGRLRAPSVLPSSPRRAAHREGRARPPLAALAVIAQADTASRPTKLGTGGRLRHGRPATIGRQCVAGAGRRWPLPLVLQP